MYERAMYEIVASLLLGYVIIYSIAFIWTIDIDDFHPDGPITYYVILFYIFLPIPFLYLFSREILKFMIQVHKNSTQPKSEPKPKSSILTFEFYNSRINAMIKEKIRMRNILNNCIKERKPRPIPEILEELDEAVEERN